MQTNGSVVVTRHLCHTVPVSYIYLDTSQRFVEGHDTNVHTVHVCPSGPVPKVFHHAPDWAIQHVAEKRSRAQSMFLSLLTPYKSIGGCRLRSLFFVDQRQLI